MCRKSNRMSCWVFNAHQDVIDSQFSHMWELTYSMHSFFILIEATYTVLEERAIYQRLKAEGLLDNW
jgi:hypothetical protein